MHSTLSPMSMSVLALISFPIFAVGCSSGAPNGGSEGGNDEKVLSVHGGEASGGGISTENVHGGTGGNDWLQARCPTVTGLHLRAATYVDSIQMECEGPGARWPSNTLGGNGGYDWPTVSCPNGYIATGVFGRSWTYLDDLGLICRKVGNMSQTWTSQPLAEPAEPRSRTTATRPSRGKTTPLASGS